MQISATQSTNLPTVSHDNLVAKPAVSFPSEPTKDTVGISRVSSLLNTLQIDPHIRPEVLERGRMLATNPNYPQTEIINKLAGMLVSSKVE